MSAPTHNAAIRILMVDDDPDDYYLTKELIAEISDHEFSVDWARDYDSGLEAIRDCGHDAYLLDYRLGPKDGLELLREALELGCKGPIIIMTGASDRKLALDALNVGAADYLVKGSFDAVGLERTIRYAIRHALYAVELEDKVRQRTAELESINAALKEHASELERFNRAMVGREQRMIELKREVNELCLRLGEDRRYPLEFDSAQA
ncbi:MAG TPA: response regulator [Pyrinomonadaceae bacterium]|nr:response regulator [Pyrinomonadaceae bacterium]